MSETKFQVLAIFKKINIRPLVSIFMFLMLYFMLDGLIVLRQSDFSSEIRFLKVAFLVARENSATVLFDKDISILNNITPIHRPYQPWPINWLR